MGATAVPHCTGLIPKVILGGGNGVQGGTGEALLLCVGSGSGEVHVPCGTGQGMKLWLCCWSRSWGLLSPARGWLSDSGRTPLLPPSSKQCCVVGKKTSLELDQLVNVPVLLSYQGLNSQQSFHACRKHRRCSGGSCGL